ncbi:MAG: 2-octaprenyl-6-methoxyphenyl hydroxylase [Alphaproteobacteria bacterium]|nr:2-octaprenyl-6-methoxyphenyl hydroxylase [Alphaproteobacteria bacterium]
MMGAEETPPERVDVLIAGGGLVGMSLGLALAGAGLEIAVVDAEAPAARRDAGFDGRVSSIALGSKRVLDGIGLWPRLAPAAEPIKEIRVTDGEAPLFLHYDHKDVGPDPLGYIVENRDTRAGLLDEAAACPTLHHIAPVRVQSLTPQPGAIIATLSDGRAIKASLAVVAEGRESKLRADAGIGITAWRYKQTGIVCTVEHERPHRGIAHERFLPAGPFAILPMRGNRSSLVWTEREDLAPGLLALPEREFHQEMARRFGDFLGALQVVGPRRSYPLSLSHAARYHAERLALIGDSAHAIHPIAGQGFNLGIRDVAVLAELIVDHHRLGLDIGTSDLLSHYERARRFDAQALIAVTDGLNRLFSNDVAPIVLARDVGLSVVNQLKPLKRFFMCHAMGTVGDLPRLARGEKL